MAHVAFPDERYNKHKLTTTYTDGVWDAPHVKDKDSYKTYMNLQSQKVHAEFTIQLLFLIVKQCNYNHNYYLKLIAPWMLFLMLK